MIGFSVNGQDLVLAPDTEVGIDFITLAETDEISDDFSLPFRVPRHPNNALLGYVADFSLHDRVVEIPGAAMSYHGVVRRHGVLHVENADDDSISLTFTVDGYVSRLRGRRLPAMDLGPAIVTTDIHDHAKAINLQSWPAASHCFPMYRAPAFYDERDNPHWNPTAEDWDASKAYEINDLVTRPTGDPVKIPLGYIALMGTTGQAPELFPLAWDRTAYGIVNHWDWDTEEFLKNTTSQSFYTLSPVFYLKHVIKEGYRSLGLQVQGTWWEDVRYDRMLLWNNACLDKGSQSNNFFVSQVGSVTVTGSDMSARRIPASDETTAPNQDASGVWDNVGFRFQPDSAGSWTLRVRVPPEIKLPNSNIYLHLIKEGTPDVIVQTRTIGDFQILLQGWAGVSQFLMNIAPGDVGSSYYVSCTLSYDVACTLEGCWVEGWKDTSSAVNTQSNTILPNEHVPDIEFSELVMDLMAVLKVRVKPDMIAGTVSLDYVQDVMRHTPRDITHLVRSPITISIDQRKTGFTWSWNVEENEIPDLSILVDQGTFPTYDDVPQPAGPGCWCLVEQDRRILISKPNNTAGYSWHISGTWFRDATIGEPERAQGITSAVAPIQSSLVSIKEELFSVPLIKDRGRSKYFTSEAGRGVAQLGIFHGMQPNATGKIYPFASAFRLAGDGSTVSSIELELTSEVGPIELHQRELYTGQVLADPLTCDLELDLDLVDAINANPLVLIHGQRCLVQRIPLQLADGTGPLIAKACRLLKLRNA